MIVKKNQLYNLLLIGSIIILGGCVEKLEPKQKSEQKVDDSKNAEKLYKDFEVDPQTQFQKERNQLIEYSVDNGLPVLSTPTGLFYLIDDEGTGEYVKKGQVIKVNYRGYFMNGEEFDSSYKRNKPLQFRVGDMIAGFNEGLSFLKKGGKAKFLIPSKLGYGTKGFYGKVPPNTPIIFDVEVLK